MVSTFTPAIQLEEPARGDQVGTWDTPVNNNMTLIDKVVGAITSISLNNSNVVLSSPQFQSKEITFSSTLTGSVIITFPSTFTKSYEIQNLCSGTSAFTVTLQTTVAGGQAVCCPPGEIIDVVNDGSSFKFKNFGRIGTYWDYAGSSVPNWVSGCTIPPFLNCDGTVYNTVNYPVLLSILGSSLVPDARGRTRSALNQGTGRMSAGGLNGNTAYAGGGVDTITLATSQIPSHSHTINISDPSHLHNEPNGCSNATTTGGGGFPAGAATNVNTAAAFTGITASAVAAGGGAAHNIVQPTYIGGLTLIRAA